MILSDAVLNNWLVRLGYAYEPASLHVHVDHVDQTHPYATEIKALLEPKGSVKARAVFDIEGIPTVIFVGGDGSKLNKSDIDAVRQRIWNQNLANIVLELTEDTVIARPARKLKNASETILASQAKPDGPFSALDVASANIPRRFPAWFDIAARVDRKLLENLSTAVKELGSFGYSNLSAETQPHKLAELLMGQVLFISYLEHRKIVGETYRAHHNLDHLQNLIAGANANGVRRLIDQLKEDFNGDFLSDDRHDPWVFLNSRGYDTLTRFLNRSDMNTGQGDFWNYDFSFIPVELLSGLYESFLSQAEKAKTGAYYTPRHLAMLTVEQALALSDDPLKETIFDGACGSGILLTTIYRRLIALSEDRTGRVLSFKQRGKLLTERIFGADINYMACRVTAFSLYLSLLEGLNPSDILEAQRKDNVKLPTLAGKNLLYGKNADFFSPDHGFLQRKFSLAISNPPWGEGEGNTITSADVWAKAAKASVGRRQIAGVFSLRTLEFLKPDGKVCFILPIGLFLGPTNAKFVNRLLHEVVPKRLINFGDLQNLLFPTGEHTCHVFVGRRRETLLRQLPVDEVFDYCVPKADMSLVYGRLAMQSADRHLLSSRSVAENPAVLVTLMWGDNFDLSLLARLEVFGRLGDFWNAPAKERRWTARKGVHFVDKSVQEVSAVRLSKMPYLSAPALRAGVPVLHADLLLKWPAEQHTVAHINDKLLNTFDGPRVLYTDGFSRKYHSVRSAFYDKPASFSTSIGVIAGPDTDADLLRFVAAYLRSTLARYLLMLNAWKMLCERNAMHLADIASFPFHEPKYAANPIIAQSVLKKISAKMIELAKLPENEQKRAYEKTSDEFDNCIFDYFDISEIERRLVMETVDVLMPSIRPRNYKNLNTPAQACATISHVKDYAQVLADELANWQKRTGGTGKFQISAISNTPNTIAGFGVVNVNFNSNEFDQATVDASSNDTLIHAVIRQLHEQGLRFIPAGGALNLVPDTFIYGDAGLSIARPMIRRSWTIRQAFRDAERIVRDVQVISPIRAASPT